MYSDQYGFLASLYPLHFPKRKGETEPGLGFDILFVTAAVSSSP